MATTTRFKKHFLVYLFVAFLTVSLGVANGNREVIAKQLNSWQLLPQPQGITELYFVDDKQLPAAVKVGSVQKVAFVIHNLEHKVTTYHYKLVVADEGSAQGQALARGTLQLNHNEQQTINETIKIPAVSIYRVPVRVELEYNGIPFGSQTAKTQYLIIQYWVKVVGL